MSPIKRIITIALLASAMAIPAVASAQVSTTTLQGELASLLAEIVQLENASTTISAPASSNAISNPTTVAPTRSSILCPQFVRTLERGSTGTDVANLQGFLAQNPLIYPEGAVTAYFGMLTQDAVERWQSAYDIVSSGTPATTGYGVVGPKTAAAMTASCEADSNASSASNTSSAAAPTSSAPEQPLCPIAPEPATLCPGTWSPLTNASGCTIAWQCAVPLPGAPQSSASSSPGTAASSSACPAYTLPLCNGGFNEWLGISSNDCNLGYQCVIPGQ